MLLTNLSVNTFDEAVEKISWYQLCFLKFFYLCDFANYMGNKNPFVIEIEFYIEQLPQQFLLKLMNMCFKSVWTHIFISQFQLPL